LTYHIPGCADDTQRKVDKMKNRIRRYTRAYHVSIGNKSTIVYTDDKTAAIDRAITKLYGADCFWFANHGLPRYGQVFRVLRPTKYNSNPGNLSVTYRVRVDVEPIGKPSREFIKQQKADLEENERGNKYLQIRYELEQRAHTAGMCGEPFPEFPEDVDIIWLKQKYQDGINDRVDWENEQQSQQKIQDENETQEYMKSLHTEALVYDNEYNEHKKRVNTEVIRLRNIPVNVPIVDKILQAITRDVAVHYWMNNGRVGKMGDFKRDVVNGKYPELVKMFLDSDMIYGRLEHVVE